MAPGFAVWLDVVEPVHHLVGLAARAEHLGAVALLVSDGGTGRDIHVAVAAMAVATHRVAILPVSYSPSPVAARRAAPALTSLAELSAGRVVGCFPAAAVRGSDDRPVLDVPFGRIEDRRRARVDDLDGATGVVAEGDLDALGRITRAVRTAAGERAWVIWSPAGGEPGDEVGRAVRASRPDAVAFRLAHHDVEELTDIAARAGEIGLSRGATLAAWADA